MKSKFIAGLLLVCLACSTSTRETPKGLKFMIVKEGDGVLPKPGQFLELNMMYKDNHDSVWMTTQEMEVPWIMSIQDSAAMENEEGIDEIFRMLSKGDSISFTISIRDFFVQTVRQPVPPDIDSTGTLTFGIGVADVLNRDQVEALQRDMVEKQNAEYAKQQAEQLGMDTLAIDSYLKEHGINASMTASGLRYVVKQPGKGPKAKQGQRVTINYAGYLLDGTYFDTSIESVARAQGLHTEGRPYEPYTLVAGGGSVIPGWEEAILLMNKGAKLTVYIPSTLAYGARARSEEIKENSILVFDMEMVDIK